MLDELLAMSKIRWLGYLVLVIALLAWFVGWVKDKIA